MNGDQAFFTTSAALHLSQCFVNFSLYGGEIVFPVVAHPWLMRQRDIAAFQCVILDHCVVDSLTLFFDAVVYTTT